MITIFGATGYTGRLIALNLAKKKIPFQIAGRSEEKLSKLSAALPGKPKWLVADATIPSTLIALFQGTQILINCAGPYTDLGERIISMAAMSGCFYLDLSNEVGFLYKARGYHKMACQTGALLVPACAFEVAFADCAAAVLDQKMNKPGEPIDEIDVIYTLGDLKASHGTQRSVIRSLATSWINYQSRQWVGAIPGKENRMFTLQNRIVYTISFPSCETITLPSHMNISNINTWLSVNKFQFRLGPIFIPLFARASRSVFRPLILKAFGRGALTPEKASIIEVQDSKPFSIDVQIRRGSDLRWMHICGYDPYALTAKIVTFAVEKFLESPNHLCGLLAPSRLFDPKQFLNTAKKLWKVSIAD